MKRWIQCASRLYPAEWRDRYGAEFEALLDDAPLQWRDLADVLRGAAMMRMMRWTSYWKVAVVAGLAAAIVACGISFTIADRWVSSASLMVVGPAGQGSESHRSEALQQVAMQVLSRDNLVAMILDPRLDLYRRERQRYPNEAIADEVFRKNIHISPLASPWGAIGHAFSVSFVYPDRFKARAVIEALVSQMQRNFSAQLTLQGLQRGWSMNVLELPLLPETPVFPNRLAITIVGLVGGISIGSLSLFIWRLRHKYAVVNISLPEDIQQFVAGQIGAGQHRDAGEYIRELIRADEQKRKSLS